MSATIKYILPSQIKKEVITESIDEDTVACRVCTKTFVSETALNNHARMEHMELYIAGRREEWTRHIEENQPAPIKMRSRRNRSPSADAEKLIQQRTEQLVSSMEPTNLTTLASEDVSYIIIKADPSELTGSSPATRKRREKSEKDKVEKKREIQPISGPFECLQPSNIVPDKVCHQIFFSCCEYSAHHRDEHTRRRKGLRCQVCEKPLPNPHSPDGMPYACDICVGGFQTSEQLESHISEAHVKRRPYECSVCGKRFTQKAGVQQHMRMHTGDKPYSCTFCTKSFTQKSGLGQHLRIHTKVRPYRCVICSKSFCQSIHLKQHMRTHTNVSPFQCGICQKRFKQSGHLNYHLKYHDPANLTEEQKKKYSELIGLIGSGLTVQEMEQDETHEAVVALENQEVLVVSEVYESEYVLGTEDDWCTRNEQ